MRSGALTAVGVEAVGVLLAFALLSAPRVLSAQTLPAVFTESAELPQASLVVTRGEGAEDCPDAASLAEQVHRVSGASVVQQGMSLAGRGSTWIQVAIVHNFGGYRAEISAGGLHHGARTLEDLGPGCASLADAITITIAIFLDPYSAPPAPVCAPSTTPKAPSAPPATAPVEPLWTPRITTDLSAGAVLPSETSQGPSVAAFAVPSVAFADASANSANSASQLKAEARALRGARAALRAGRYNEAFATLEASRRRFSAPELDQEREALTIELLAHGGQHEAATQRAKAFLNRFPDSPHASRVRQFAVP